ncbi:MAG: truA [Haloplasmataceae bacterium]|jgi:tRNA pseudouridine38-40 synthase|nr:truA [Haloplasmataceae bacterium]
MKRNIKLTIAYEGTKYLGFQRLGDSENTIQEKLEKCLSRLLEEEILVIGASRTDAGAHALDQIVNFHTYNQMELDDMLVNINKFLPEDIITSKIEEVSDSFHSRYWVDKKTYLYRIYTGVVPPLFERKFVYFLGKNLDINKMKKASQLLIGEKDFQGFSRKNTKKSTVRNIYNIEFKVIDNELQLYFTADGFLYNMVRILVGTLIEIGLNQREIESINEIFANGVRAEAGYLVPASGLVLFKNHFKN